MVRENGKWLWFPRRLFRLWWYSWQRGWRKLTTSQEWWSRVGEVFPSHVTYRHRHFATFNGENEGRTFPTSVLSRSNVPPNVGHDLGRRETLLTTLPLRETIGKRSCRAVSGPRSHRTISFYLAIRLHLQGACRWRRLFRLDPAPPTTRCRIEVPVDY